MWTLIKGAFWFSLVLIALPLFNPESAERLESGPTFESAGSASAVMALYQDVISICEREPEVCTVGTHTIGVLGARAKEGARIAYNFLDNQFGDQDKLTPNSDLSMASIPAPN
jgi:hypothetical protein